MHRYRKSPTSADASILDGGKVEVYDLPRKDVYELRKKERGRKYGVM
jgi:hypothetical protein